MAVVLPALLVGKTLGETVFRVVLGLLLAFAAVSLAWGLISGRIHVWRADYWKGMAREQAEVAKVERANARSSDAGAVNATATRDRIDLVVSDARGQSAAAAERIESHVPSDADRDAAPDADVVRELEAAERRARAAAGRLQRADAG